MSRLLLVVALGFGVGLPASADGELPQAPPPRPIPVAELVAQLGVGPLAQREAAERRLSALTVEPPPAEVLAALKSSNLDARDRAARIIQAMRWNIGATRLPRGLRFADRGRVDLFVEATAAWDLKPDDDRLWEPALNLGRLLVEKADLKGDRKPACPASYRDYATYIKWYKPMFTRVDKPYTRPDPRTADPPVLAFNEAIQAPGVVDFTSISNNLIISRGSVQTERIIKSSVIFANGDVVVQGVIASSVIVCDGDVTVLDRDINQSLVVARGNITIKGGTSESTLIAGGKVIVTAQQKFINKNRYSDIKEDTAGALGFITFFELATVGLEVKVADKVVQVSAVAAGKPCDKAKLKVGDTLLSVNGKKFDSAESLRRALRDALALGDATVTFRRGDKTETATVALPD